MNAYAPKKKIKVGILGATGMVGQQYVKLLSNHPWFIVSYVAASSRSAGKTYGQAVSGRWHMDREIPEEVKKLTVHDANEVSEAAGNCSFVFSSLEIEDKEALRNLENEYAKAGLPVVSNASAHRQTEDVPMIIPEINADHLEMIPLQQKKRNWRRGFVIVKPNCSLQSYMAPIFALIKAGYEINKILVTTMQAVSGAGYPGVASLDILDNVVPYIGGEEEKTEQEPLKILGEIKNGVFVKKEGILISAHCNRVPVTDGHLACVSIGFSEKKPRQDEIIKIWGNFSGLPQELGLPFAPSKPIIYREEPNRPQTRKDRNADKAMAVTVGRLRPCPVLDYKFAALSHNTVRGAAGGGILNAELAVAKNYIS